MATCSESAAPSEKDSFRARRMWRTNCVGSTRIVLACETEGAVNGSTTSCDKVICP